jgi:hypothetical protein
MDELTEGLDHVGFARELGHGAVEHLLGDVGLGPELVLLERVALGDLHDLARRRVGHKPSGR